MPNTCKSNEERYFGSASSGERVSNTWVTYPEVRDNGSKGLLIPHVDMCFRRCISKAAMRFGRGLRPIS